jgi:hypothetical protein
MAMMLAILIYKKKIRRKSVQKKQYGNAAHHIDGQTVRVNLCHQFRVPSTIKKYPDRVPLNSLIF